MHQHNSLVVLSAMVALLAPECLLACEARPFGAIRARSAILLEVGSAQELVSHEPTTPIAPASLVKLMTVYLTFEAVKAGQVQLKDEVVVSEAAWRMGGSQMFLQPGDRVPLRELLRGVAIAGANDAAVAVAEHLAGGIESFVAQMNRQAKKLALRETVFRNPHGLPHPEQVTTARDMARLAAALLRDYPEGAALHAERSITYRGIRQYNRNRLLGRDRRVDGLRTGYLSEAGYHLVATARAEGRRLIAVVLGAASEQARAVLALDLLRYGFGQFTIGTLFASRSPLRRIPIWEGTEDTVTAVAAEAGTVSIPLGKTDAVKVTYDVAPSLVAPVEQGAVLGRATITCEDRLLREVDLVADRAVPQAWIGKRLLHRIWRVLSPGGK